MTAFAVVLMVIAAGITIHQSLAFARRELGEFGDHLSQLAGLTPHGVHHLRINGQPLRLEVATTRQPVSAVLDHFESWCMGHDGRFAESQLLDATVREEARGRGYVACLNTGGRKLSVNEIVERLQRYQQTQNVAELGDFHYMRVEPGHDGVTRVVSVWVEDDFYLHQMFPASGDAPGKDARGVPRPKTGRRLLSAAADDNGYQWTVYDGVEGSESSLLARYRSWLAAADWKVLVAQSGVLVAHRDQETVFISVAKKSDERSFVGIVNAAEKESL
jgi:hypothetical protein